MSDGNMLYRVNAVEPDEERAKLYERLADSSERGDLEATRILVELQEGNRYRKLLNNLDDDEFAIPLAD